MSYVKYYDPITLIRERTQTNFIVIHYVDADEALAVSNSREEFLWNLEAQARDYSIHGHGVHYIVEPTAVVSTPRPHTVFGNFIPKYNVSGIYIRVPMLDGNATDEQEDEVDVLIDQLKCTYGEHLVIKFATGWEVISK